jgi:hypothetical protein
VLGRLSFKMAKIIEEKIIKMRENINSGL